MTTTIGAVIYGIPMDIAHKALQVGVEFYACIDIPIEECVYTIKTDPDKNGEVLHLVDATVKELQEKTKSEEVKSLDLLEQGWYLFGYFSSSPTRHPLASA